MKKQLLFILSFFAFTTLAFSQTTILDFEAPETTTDFQYFGSGLDGTLTTVIANPNSSGINTSANVAQYIKAGDALTWAGAFSNPDPMTPIDATTGGQLCIKVHMDHIGNLALKLENSTTGGPNWIFTKENTVMNEWEEICFELNDDSIEDPFLPAFGHVYPRAVLFFDFGAEGGGSDVNYYFDDIVLKGGGGAMDVNVTFRVNMSDYTGSFDAVHVRGGFNNWSEDNMLTDVGGGIYEGTVTIPTGVHEFKYWLAGADVWEEFTKFYTCTVTTPDGAFTNRQAVITTDTEMDAVCFNSCYACGEEAMLTFELGFSGVDPSPDGVWVAGGGNFDVPGGLFQMTDDNADGIYTITMPRQKGFSSFYTFANGNCPDWSCKEDIAGQGCAQPANFNDRWLPELTDDTVISTCFAICSEDAMTCLTSTRDLQVDQNIFQLSPTLVNDFAQLSFNADLSDAKSIQVLNMLGQVENLVELEGYATDYQLNTSKLATGIYFVHVQIGNKIATKKIVKQ